MATLLWVVDVVTVRKDTPESVVTAAPYRPPTEKVVPVVLPLQNSTPRP